MLVPTNTEAKSSWTDDFTQCNISKALGWNEWNCPFEPTYETMISAGQRTNTSDGLQVKAASWIGSDPQNSTSAEKDHLFVSLILQTPQLVSGNVVEMFFSIEDEANSTVFPSFDTVLCTVEWLGEESNQFLGYEAHDLSQTNISLYDERSEGTYRTQVEKFYDTAKKGSEDWNVLIGKSSASCADFFCTFQCTMHRKLLTEDKANDV